jgi:hypothetical protein
MKKCLFCLFLGSLLLLSFSSRAQPNITGTGVNPVIGETITEHRTTFHSPGTSGVNQTWNFASWASTATVILQVVNPTVTTYGSSFPNANTAFTTVGSASAAYYKYSSTAMQNYGSYSSVVIAYSNPEDLLRYPFSYNNTYTDTWTAQYVNSTYTFYRKGSSTVTADGYGTLITPSGTFTNVLRVHLVQTYQDSAYLGTPYIVTYSNDEYMWYKEGMHYQLASTYNLIPSVGNSMSGSTWTDASSGIENLSDIISSCKLYPNPASDKLNIEMKLENNQDMEINLYNSMGQKLTAYKVPEAAFGEYLQQINVEQLPKGVYFAEIIAAGKRSLTKRFLVAR